MQAAAASPLNASISDASKLRKSGRVQWQDPNITRNWVSQLWRAEKKKKISWVARKLKNLTKEVLLFIDNIFRFVQAGQPPIFWGKKICWSPDLVPNFCMHAEKRI